RWPAVRHSQSLRRHDRVPVPVGRADQTGYARGRTRPRACCPEGQHERARMRAVVTGGAGFIGHHLVDGLVSSGHDVSVIDDVASGRYSRLAKFGDAVTLPEATILDADDLDVAVAGADVIFHEAAIASVARSL